MSFKVRNAIFELVQDSWTNGEIGKPYIWNESSYVEIKDTIEELLEETPYLFDDASGNNALPTSKRFRADPCEDGDFSRFDTDLTVAYDMVHDMIRKPTSQEFELFKAGKLNLWSLHISVYIDKISKLSKEDVVKFIEE